MPEHEGACQYLLSENHSLELGAGGFHYYRSSQLQSSKCMLDVTEPFGKPRIAFPSFLLKLESLSLKILRKAF